MLAALEVEDVWKPDRQAEVERVFGTANPEHPGVAPTQEESHEYYVGGTIEGLQPPVHYDGPGGRDHSVGPPDLLAAVVRGSPEAFIQRSVMQATGLRRAV